MTNNTVFVDQERTTQSNACIRMFDAIRLLNFTLNVSHHRIFHRTNTAIIDRGVTPCVMNELGVERNTNDFHTTFFKLSITLIKSD